ncbi:MAG: amidase [Hyphomicrobiales bacterium]|nr:amidase [Hyphomicrobiales bacterium]
MNASEDLYYLTVKELTKRYARKELSPVDVTKAVLQRIESDNPVYNAFCWEDPENAIISARQSEQRWMRGEPCGLIDGIPTTVKDLILTKGWPTLRGSRTVDPSGPWDEDAPVTDKLRKHGAIFLGKTTTPEFGSKGVTESPLTGSTRNGWNDERTSGGSSGGAGTAAARGYGVLHVGTDAAGSVRIPASFNGIFSLKPTFGLVPVFPPSPLGTISHVGPMTRTVDDAARMMSVITEPDARDWYALPRDDRIYHNNLDRSLDGIKIAYSKDLGFAKVNADVAETCSKAVELFRESGAIVEDIDSPLNEDPAWITDRLWFAAFLTITDAMTTKEINLMDPLLVSMLERARELTVSDILEARKAREDMSLKLCNVHTDYDLLVTPTMPMTAFEAGPNNPSNSSNPEDWIRWSSFTYPFNLSQQPAASCPCGFGVDGMPIGLQIVGPKYADYLVLQASRAFERLFPFQMPINGSRSVGSE